MMKKQLRYPTVLFDWVDTVMRDHPEITIPMVEWETVKVVEGIPDVLAYLHVSGRRIVLATSAEVSDESQIREDKMHCTIHTMPELIAFFESLEK